MRRITERGLGPVEAVIEPSTVLGRWRINGRLRLEDIDYYVCYSIEAKDTNLTATQITGRVCFGTILLLSCGVELP